jgi:hypothetical protein
MLKLKSFKSYQPLQKNVMSKASLAMMDIIEDSFIILIVLPHYMSSLQRMLNSYGLQNVRQAFDTLKNKLISTPILKGTN